MHLLILYYVLIGVLWFIADLRRSLVYLSHFQQKEYRLKRIWDFMCSNSGLRFWLNYSNLIRILFLIFLLFEIIRGIGELFILLVVFEAILFGVSIYLGKIIRPRLTVKMVLLVILAISSLLVFLFWAVLYNDENLLRNMLIFDLFLPFILLIWVMFFYPFTWIAKKYYIWRARRYLLKFPNLKVIGITGSYGKTTTKEFLTTVLRKKFTVRKTPQHINTEIGVARFILQKDFRGIDIFVVEMGAYQRGDIKTICRMVYPEIGILTAINEQHLSLFGSLEKIKKAKYELIAEIPKTGLAVMNMDNRIVQNLANKTKHCALQTYSLDNTKADLSARHIKVSSTELQFDLQFKSDAQKEFKVYLSGRFQISNLLPVIIIARYLGMDWDDIRRGLKKIEAVSQTMEVIKKDDSIIIDDSYNANPDGVIVAIETLKNYSGYQKIVVITSIIELGKVARQKHFEIGKVLGKTVDKLFIKKSEWAGVIRDGAIKGGLKKDQIVIGRKFDIGHEKSVVLFEGRGTKQ